MNTIKLTTANILLMSILMTLFNIHNYNLESETTHEQIVLTEKNHSPSSKKMNNPPTENITTTPDDIPITIAFTGDILLDKSVGELIEKNGVDYPFSNVSELLKQSDLTAGNLETSVSLRGTPDDKQFTFRSKPDTLQGLVNSGFDMVSLANNHTLDYGYDALLDTIDNLNKYQIGYSGAGKNQEEAFSAYKTTVKGKKISIISLSRVIPTTDWFATDNKAGLAHAYQMEPMLTYVKKATEESDYTIVMIHWNKERMDFPEEYARDYARMFQELGVDAVIGGHSHSLMGIEFIKEMPVFYSLGNFVFTNSSSPKSHETMIVYVTFNGTSISSKIIPAKLINGQPTLMDDKYNEYIRTKITNLSYNAKVNPDGSITNTEKQ